MIRRVVEVSSPARLSLSNRQMVIERKDEKPVAVPVEDLGLLIFDHRGITHTQGLLVECWKYNVVVLLCDDKHLPGAILLPLDGHSLQSKIMARQVQITEPSRKRLWQSLVRAKIRAQARTLLTSKGLEGPLPALIERVRSGDPENIEAQAARVYWQHLFGTQFKRGEPTLLVNGLLNYGYAIARSACARALVGAGLHPSLGLHHHNQYDAFCLADDLVEPLRPMVDLAVYRLVTDGGASDVLGKEQKQALLEILTQPCTIGELRLPLLEALHHYAASLRQVVCGETDRLAIPQP
jgi:CRISPR-associated protein Cas1